VSRRGRPYVQLGPAVPQALDRVYAGANTR
jgi:hypothetical protein